jgi:hypothetical protein
MSEHGRERGWVEHIAILLLVLAAVAILITVVGAQSTSPY